ncbi:MAG: hypothetical protein U5L95_02060 [Candidatus Saccharibacteria bacterium]|nr:hypothetical protein [Candidatus Saccharibacteria bacterium]
MSLYLVWCFACACKKYEKNHNSIMQIAHFEQDGMAYDFEPPIEVGDNDVKTIHHLAAVALLGPEIERTELLTAMRGFADILQVPHDRTEAFNIFLAGKHVVKGRSLPGGMPTWRSEPPPLEPVPGATLSPKASRQLQEKLAGIRTAEWYGAVGANNYYLGVRQQP